MNFTAPSSSAQLKRLSAHVTDPAAACRADRMCGAREQEELQHVDALASRTLYVGYAIEEDVLFLYKALYNDYRLTPKKMFSAVKMF